MGVEGSYLDPKKVVAEGFPIPKYVTNVRAFLGLTKYYKKIILGYAKITKPLFGLIKKDYKFLWIPICQGAFVTLKKRRMASPMLTRPNFSKPFILDVD